MKHEELFRRSEQVSERGSVVGYRATHRTRWWQVAVLLAVAGQLLACLVNLSHAQFIGDSGITAT